MAASHSSDSEKASAKIERRRMMARLRDRAKKLADPDIRKRKYRVDKERNPDINKQRYQRSLERDPEFNKKKYRRALELDPDRNKKRNAGKARANRKPRKYKPRLTPKTAEQRARERERCRKKYYANRSEKIAKVVARQRLRYSKDPEYVIRIRLRGRIRYALAAMQAKRAGKYVDLAGCTAAQLKSHIESQFAEGMTWSNKHMWHIDHIIPVSLFDLSTEEGQRAAFHYTNMRPLWAEDNRKKHAKPPVPQRRFGFGYEVLAEEQRSLGTEGRLGTERRRA
jgi:hypothetical protein